MKLKQNQKAYPLLSWEFQGCKRGNKNLYTCHVHEKFMLRINFFILGCVENNKIYKEGGIYI